MNSLLVTLGLASWKPVFTAALLPPTPFLLLLFVSSGFATRRPAQMRVVGVCASLAIWLSSSTGAAEFLQRHLLPRMPALAPLQIAAMRSQPNHAAIVVLGGGAEDRAPEYGRSSLTFRSLERLRYGIWLARQTQWPVAFSGGVGWAQEQAGAATRAESEAAIAQNIATREFGLPLRWLEDRSRDTHENAVNTVELLRYYGISRVLIVTHEWHMPRAIRNFETAANGKLRIEAAPIGLATRQELPLLRWFPSGNGISLTREVIRERIGLWSGA